MDKDYQSRLNAIKLVLFDFTLELERLTAGLTPDSTEVISNILALKSELKSFSDCIVEVEREDFRFLLVDDEPDFLNLIRGYLHDFGYKNLEVALDGEEALEKCISMKKQGLAFDLVISDWRMPKMDGLQLLTELRGMEAFQYLPFLILTGDPSFSEQAKKNMPKLFQYGSKSILPEALGRKVRWMTCLGKV